MNAIVGIEIPHKLPLLEAICWDLPDINTLNPDKILNRYERCRDYRGALADLGDEERRFLAKVARLKGS